ncbi:hypothetical protein A2U01_0092839, partial [Trifolium medium]|nr:hypothetical protein [Trifolium medium]
SESTFMVVKVIVGGGQIGDHIKLDGAVVVDGRSGG